MNVRFLIDRLVRHHAVLLAELATSGGARAPLAELLDQTFIHLAEELERRGVSRKVSADMFGMVLRAYLKKIQRLQESTTERGTSLWEAVLRYVNDKGTVRRSEVLSRFVRDDETQVRAVLFDLVESGIFIAEGQGPNATVRVASLERLESNQVLSDLLWLIVFKEGPVRRADLLQRSGRRGAEFDQALGALLESGRIRQTGDGDDATYTSRDFVRPPGEDGGWEAAVLDHFGALVSTVRGVVSRQVGSDQDSLSGGFTYAFDVWPGHPLETEVEGTLHRLREQLTDLRERVDAANASLGRPVAYREVTVYGGQSSRERKSEG